MEGFRAIQRLTQKSATAQPRNRAIVQEIHLPLVNLLLVLNAVLFLFVSQVNGQVPKIAPEWKAHFKTTPVIENCVFERETPPITEGQFVSKGETNSYQFRRQENAFLIREIQTTNNRSDQEKS
jgi:hypothetical protein